ncbi:MAG: ABC transporter permease [Bacteroidia bacterium]|nr:ABC transporter permease [Bacteroidia bacterium]
MYLKLAWRNIWRNKRRTFITAGSILFAVFFAIGMRSMQFGTYDKSIENIVGFYTGYAQIHKLGYHDDPSINKCIEYTETLQNLSNNFGDEVTFIPRLESFALASYDIANKGVMLVGIDPEKEQTLTKLNKKLIDGDYITASDKSVILTEGLAEYLKLKVNDTIVFISQGYHGVSAAGKYPVKGIVKFASPDLNQRLAFFPLKEAQWFYGADNMISTITLSLKEHKQLDYIIAKLEGIINTEEYEIIDWKTMIPEILQQIELDSKAGLIILFILYMIIGFGIFGTILMMTTERRYEFGILVAIGMKRYKLSIIVWLEVLMMAILGIIGGILISIPVTYYFHINPIEFTGEAVKAFEKFGVEPIIPFSMDPTIYIGQAIMVFIMTVLISIYPLYVVSNIKPVAAMRG